jgi:hypothetical protein
MPASGCPEDRAPSAVLFGCQLIVEPKLVTRFLGVEFDILGATTFGASMQKSEYLAGAG